MFFGGQWRGLALVYALAAGVQAWGAGFPDCPQSDRPDELEDWKNAAIRELSSNGQSAFTHINSCFQAGAPSCMQRVKDYSERFNLADINADVPAKDDPRKQPPAELVSDRDGLTGAVELNGDLERISREKGWPMVRYKSRYSGGFDAETPSLLMIRVPGEKMNPPVDYDRYLNIPLPADQGDDELNPVPQQKVVTPDDFKHEGRDRRTLPRTFTIVTIKKKTGADPSRIYFARYVRNGSNQTKFTPLPAQGAAACYSCHVSGMREISPLGYHVRDGERQMPVDMWKATREMNDSMEINMGYSVMDWGGIADSSGGKEKTFLLPSSYGPLIGPLAPLTREEKVDAEDNKTITFPTRTKEFILGKDGQPGCAQLRPQVSVVDIFNRAPGRNNVYTLTQDPPIRWERVRDAMKCASCHNNKQRGALNSGTGFGEIDFKVLVDQSMPYGWHRNPVDRGNASKPVLDLLNPNERIAVVNCLQAEWRQEQSKLSNWFTENSCKQAQ